MKRSITITVVLVLALGLVNQLAKASNNKVNLKAIEVIDLPDVKIISITKNVNSFSCGNN